VLLRVKEQRNILDEIRKRKANWIGHILRSEPFRTQHPRSECSKVVLSGIVHWVELTKAVN